MARAGRCARLAGAGGADAVKELETEIAFYKETKPELLRSGHEGRIVLIRGREIIGVFVVKQEAYREGC